ncbi:MAG: hypothetical protein HY581_10585 [Nitrospirae bacterium]|nr:hypothetical protein [Nitrospirota bacterium]
MNCSRVSIAFTPTRQECASTAAITAFLFLFTVAGCAMVPLDTPPAPDKHPAPSLAEFQDKILVPLAAKKANEVIQRARADAQQVYAKRERERMEQGVAADNFIDLLSLIAAVPPNYWLNAGGQYLRHRGAVSRQSVSELEEAQLKEFVAWLETRRVSLKAKILALYAGRMKETRESDRTIFSVCVDGKDRRYSSALGEFIRLDDSPGVCPPTKVTLADESPSKGD